MKIVNLTPHSIRILPEDEDGEEVIIPPSGAVARFATNEEFVGTLHTDHGALPIVRTVPGEIMNLPEPDPNVVLVVSLAVASRLPRRIDLFVPHGLVRDEHGAVIGCRSLSFVE